MRTFKQSAIVRFILFLVHPEDSRSTAMPLGKQQHFTQFDNHLAGAIKIVFWIVTLIFFWTAVPIFCCYIKKFM